MKANFASRGFMRAYGARLLYGLATLAAFGWAVSNPAFVDGCLPPPRYILVVIIDAARADHVSCYGSRGKTTPNVDALAEEAVLFENAYSNSTWTRPTIASLLTGLWPGETGTVYWSRKLPDGTEAFTRMFRNVETLAGVLTAKGYRTIGFPNVGEAFGLARGFDVYEQRSANCDKTVSRFLSWQESLGGGAFFGYLHFPEPHAPYRPPPPYSEMFGDHSAASEIITRVGSDYDKWAQYQKDVNRGEIKPSAAVVQGFRNLYDGEIAYADAALGTLVASLKKRGIYQETMLIVTADHGESLLEHGVLGHPIGTLFEGQIHVPLVIKFPRSWHIRPARFKGLVQTIDLTATISKLATGRLLGRGRDLLPACVTGWLPPAAVIIEAPRGLALRTGKMKVLFTRTKLTARVTKVFDLEADPGERSDIRRKVPDFMRRARQKAVTWDDFVSARAQENAR